MSKILRFGAVIALLCIKTNLFAQNITERHWYFGNSAEAFVFDKGARTATEVDNQATPFGNNGSTVIADKQKGNLLFYSDGEVIYDNQHEILPGMGADRLNGDLSKIQPVVSCPFPDGSGQYYIFTNSGASIDFTVLDTALTGNSTVNEFPRGDVSGALNQPTGITNTGELLKVLEGADGQTFYLITQGVTTLDLMVTPITSAGLGTTTNYDVFPSSLPGFEATGMAVKEDSLGNITLAISPRGTNRNIALLDFDNTTGEITFQQQIINSGFADTGSEVIYDLEWSNDGSKLYFSRKGDDTNGANLYQVDFTDTTATNPPVVPVFSSTVHRSYGLKRGPDGRIYHLYQLASGADFTIGRINQGDSTVDTGIFYDSLAFGFNAAGRQFPEFAPAYYQTNYFNSVDFTYLDSCQHSVTKFIALVNPLPDRYFWDFGDGTFGSGPTVNHEYEGPGGPVVSLTVELNGYSQTVTNFIEILQSDSVDLGNDTTICVDEELELSAGNDGIQYIWSTGETDSTITVDTAGTYWVEKTFASGCTAYDEIVVTEYGVQSQFFNQWYFGEMAGLDFNFNPPQALADANQMFSPEGCATVSDQNGQLLFYTNGNTVWNKEHEVMVNGTNLGGDSTSAQSAMILPFANENTMFYIFSTEEVYGDFTFNMKMSIVDMKKDTARGQVLIKNIPIVECSTERVTASGFTGTPFLLAHEYGNNNFRAYQVNDNGVVGPLHSSAGEEHIFEEEPSATGYMKFAPGAETVAVLIPGATNYVDILDFDITNAEVSNSRLIDIEEAGSLIYGLEFSGDGQNLFISTSDKILKYRLDSLNSDDPVTDIMSTKEELPGTPSGIGALQMGPNGVIYIAEDGSNALGEIQNPGGLTVADVSYTAGSQDLLGRTSRLGLPNFTQQVNTPSQEPSIATTVACAGVETQFSGTGRDSSIEFYTWDFGDGTPPVGPLNSPDTTHIYTVDSTYIVTLTLTNRCDTAYVLTDTIEVFTIPEEPMVPTDTALCGGSVTLSAWDVDRDDLNYYWSTGDSTREVTFSSPAIVDVAIISDSGCSSDTLTVFIGDGESFVDLGPDLTICQNDSIILDSNDPGPDYTWTRNGIVVGEERTQLVNSSTAGDFVYAVEVINDFTGCIYTDSVTVSILPAPTATQSDVVNPECSEANGSFSLTIDDPGNFTYEISGPVAAGPFTFDGPGTTPAITGLSSGSYTATITNSLTGCANTQILQLEDNAAFEMEAIPQNACARTSDILLSFTRQVPAQVEINVFNETGTSIFSATEDLRNSTYNINDLDSGTYYVEVRDINPPGCIQTDTVQLSISQECYRSIFVPNAFSPNGNGQNDEWFAFPNEFIDQFQVFVFNRWGDLVFYSRDKNFRWDGTFSGGEVAQGTYAYRMLFTSTLEPEEGTLEQYGSVTVIK